MWGGTDVGCSLVPFRLLVAEYVPINLLALLLHCLSVLYVLKLKFKWFTFILESSTFIDVNVFSVECSFTKNPKLIMNYFINRDLRQWKSGTYPGSTLLTHQSEKKKESYTIEIVFWEEWVCWDNGVRQYFYTGFQRQEGPVTHLVSF